MASGSQSSNEGLLAEIEAIRAEFENCKVVNNVGDYRCIVEVPMQALGTTLKFQVSDSYPALVPDFIAKSKRLDADQLSSLRSAMESVCVGQRSGNESLLLDMIESADSWLQAMVGVGGGEEEVTCLEKGKSASKQKQASVGRHRELMEEDHISKKPPMRTADDVIKRIVWDKSLNATHFSIGYLDRFIGIIERPFADFCWEDLSGVDQNVLAIPKHRIEFFKYGGNKVWEKSTRLDNVFGSTGSGLTIVDVAAASSGVCEQAASNCSAQQEDDVDKDATTPAPGRSKAAPSTLRPRPNYFVCIPVDDTDMVKKVTTVQADLASRCSELTPYLMPPSRLHVTLAVLHLPSLSVTQAVAASLQTVCHEWARGTLPLHVAGISDFSRRVLYARVCPSIDLSDFAAAVRARLASCGGGVAVCDEGFVPHITIVKVPFGVARSSGPRVDASDVAAGSDAATMPFGDVTASEVRLCAFAKDDLDLSDFYTCVSATQIGSSRCGDYVPEGSLVDEP